MMPWLSYQQSQVSTKAKYAQASLLSSSHHKALVERGLLFTKASAETAVAACCMILVGNHQTELGHGVNENALDVICVSDMHSHNVASR